ncbi:hypothetical protein PHYSODRAFT_294258 [Phytophthora sojae]|uniref:Uncharacterized protein n=1 Tax=Phytophthora sojae (strain P6497) TaxID=1094619 RepID=G4YKJ5_PHYSP|nr:hypothetical protein PHYSODRAFT_294258 [Phytophthora sojae]EGZ28827.1 hypothetical protein PHYSODRAFT_294258 [Phytophthora sojae]|eukprot:XP_009516102.1 hypothetical protein PHYSODRAFT_294258 [Phytophthora sojae]
MERTKYFRLVEGATRPRRHSLVRDLVVPAGAGVVAIRKAVCKSSLPPEIHDWALKVFANDEVKSPLDEGASLDGYGETADDPLVVQVPRVWYRLMEVDGRTPFAGIIADRVPLTEENTMTDVRDAVFAAWQSLFTNLKPSQLTIYGNQAACDSSEPLDVNAQIESLGQTPQTALIIVVPASVRVRSREESKDEVGVDEVPAKRHKPTQWEWKEEDPVYSVMGNRLFFVDRDRATQQLLGFHKSNYDRATNGGGGGNWVAPLVDHVFGLGKSTFGWEYIRRYNQIWDEFSEMEKKKEENGFLDIVRKCHTITLQFTEDDFLNDDLEFDGRKAARSLVERIGSYFSEIYGDNIPQALDPNAISHNRFVGVLRSLAMEVGPLFIVIDEIGLAFDADLPDTIKRERFMAFCRRILLPLFSVNTLFFLIAGRAPFLSYVHLRPDDRFMVRRLSLILFAPCN